MKLPRIIKILIVLGTLTIGTRGAHAQATDPFLGEIVIVPYNFAPRGWALCEGQLLSIAENTALFSLLGTQYGGDGRTTFGLPNLNGRFPLGTDYSGASGFSSNGLVGGSSSYTLTVAELPAHSHPIVASTSEASVSSPAGALMAGKARVPLYAVVGSANTVMAPTASTGNNEPYPVMPPYTTVTYIIALFGVFPSRS